MEREENEALDRVLQTGRRGSIWGCTGVTRPTIRKSKKKGTQLRLELVDPQSLVSP